jgi:putative flippase GtrA
MSGLTRFAAVGTLGFVVDSSVLYAGLGLGLTLLSGRLVSFLTAATFTWYCNRRFTFRSIGNDHAREWLRYLMVNSVGGGVNLGAYAALVGTVRAFAEMPVFAVAAGSVIGLIFNFALSRALVFGLGSDDLNRNTVDQQP